MALVVAEAKYRTADPEVSGSKPRTTWSFRKGIEKGLAQCGMAQCGTMNGGDYGVGDVMKRDRMGHETRGQNNGIER